MQRWPQFKRRILAGALAKVAAGLYSLTPRLPARPAVLPREPMGGQQRWHWVPALPGKGTASRDAVSRPWQNPAGAGSWAAGTSAEPKAPPAVPIPLASCLRPRLGSREPDVSSPSLPSRFLGGKLSPGRVSQGRDEFPWKWDGGPGSQLPAPAEQGRKRHIDGSPAPWACVPAPAENNPSRGELRRQPAGTESRCRP